MINKLYKICEALSTRFPGTSDPFRILARLMEESGELADQVHLRESVGRKRDICVVAAPLEVNGSGNLHIVTHGHAPTAQYAHR